MIDNSAQQHVVKKMSIIASQSLQAKVVAVLNDMTQDWDVELDGGIGGDTRLVADLAFESIDFVQFAVSLEQAVNATGLPFEKLFMKDGEYIDDLSVTQVVEFLSLELPSVAPRVAV
jgi:acyl carrier protein